MLIATFALGDMVTTLTKRDKVSQDDVDCYILSNLDLVTDKRYDKVFQGENVAVRAFCAAISCDEPDLTKDVANLRADPAMVPFLC